MLNVMLKNGVNCCRKGLLAEKSPFHVKRKALLAVIFWICYSYTSLAGYCRFNGSVVMLHPS
jgi:hypothetical protein